jgi:hypothetical protein
MRRIIATSVLAATAAVGAFLTVTATGATSAGDSPQTVSCCVPH